MKSVEQHFLYKGKERFRMASNNDSEKPKKQGWHISRDKAISKEGRMKEKKKNVETGPRERLACFFNFSLLLAESLFLQPPPTTSPKGTVAS